jgi:hypothetical protein
MFSGNGKQLHAGLTIAIVASIWLSIAAGNAVSEAGMLANVPSTITVEMWELQPNGNRGGQRCINYGGVRSSNWGCTAYCSQVSPYPCTNPVTDPPPVPKPSGQNAWVYPFTSNQVTVEIDGSATYDGSTYNRYLHDVVPQETHPEAFAAKAVTAQAIAVRTYAYHRGSAGTIDNSAGYQVYVPFRYDSPAIVPPGSTHTLDVFVQNTGIHRTSRSASAVAPRFTCPSSAEDTSPRTIDAASSHIGRADYIVANLRRLTGQFTSLPIYHSSMSYDHNSPRLPRKTAARRSDDGPLVG